MVSGRDRFCTHISFSWLTWLFENSGPFVPHSIDSEARSRRGGRSLSAETILVLRASIGIANDQLPGAVPLASENLDRPAVNWTRLSRVIDRRTLEIGG